MEFTSTAPIVRNVPYPKPLFPDLHHPEGIAPPDEFEVRKDSVSGPRIRSVDLDRESPGVLPPGQYVLVVRWPIGEVVAATGRKGGYLPGGKVFFDVPEPPPPPPAPAPAPALPPELTLALGELGRGLQALGSRLERLEAQAHQQPAGAGLQGELLQTLLRRALEPPPPPPDPLEQMQKLAGMAETFARWGKQGGPAGESREPSGGEIFAGALDTVGKHISAALQAAKGDAADASVALATLQPRELAGKLATLGAEQLGAWIADAVEQGVLPDGLLEDSAAEVVSSALKLGPEATGKLTAALKLAQACFEVDEPAAAAAATAT